MFNTFFNSNLILYCLSYSPTVLALGKMLKINPVLTL